MFTLISVMVWLGLRWQMPATGLGPDQVGLLLGVSAATIALSAWHDLAPTQEQWRTPFASAVAYVVGLSLYAATLPSGLALAPPVALFAEFAVGLAAPLALLSMPGVKAMMVPWGRPNWAAPRQSYFRAVITVLVGFICMASLVGPMVQSIPTAAASMTTLWGEMLAALAGLVFFLSLLDALALGWEQLADA